jgi:surface protein
MTGMFSDCEKFNQDISNWNTGKVQRMDELFYHARVFNQDLSEWCV